MYSFQESESCQEMPKSAKKKKVMFMTHEEEEKTKELATNESVAEQEDLVQRLRKAKSLDNLRPFLATEEDIQKYRNERGSSLLHIASYFGKMGKDHIRTTDFSFFLL